jgi:hypothetical protein
VLIVAGVFLDPDIDESGRDLAQEYAENPGVTQLSALSFHFAFVMWAPLVFALVGLVRGRGAWLANVAAVLAVLGATTLPGFLLTDFYDIAIVDAFGLDGWDRVDEELEDLPGASVLFVSAALGFLLCLPVALFAAWRAALLPALDADRRDGRRRRRPGAPAVRLWPVAARAQHACALLCPVADGLAAPRSRSGRGA